MGITGVFFVGDLEKGVVKVGVSNNVESRLGALNRKCSYDLKILCVISYGDKKLKKRLKQVFKDYQKQGDWFYYEGKLKKFINELIYLKKTKDTKGFNQLIKETTRINYKKELLKLIIEISHETGGGAVPISKAVYEMLVRYEDHFKGRSYPENTIKRMIYDFENEKVLYEPLNGFIKFC